MTARGTDRQTDVVRSATSRTPLPSCSDPSISSYLTPTFAGSTSSPTSSTPQRGRQTIRYPDSLGRVPLHRRGTSKTYECLEDLLREAGYKETRVFTPETDRNARSAAGKYDGGAGNGMRGSVGAVVDFITGLVSRGSSVPRETAPLENPALLPWSPPSPLAHAQHIREDRAKRISSVVSLSRTGSSENIRRRTHIDTRRDASRHARTHQAAQLHQSSQGLPHQPRSEHRAHQHPNNRHHHQLNYSSKSSSTKPNPPNARAYLRHMVSAPNIQPLIKRPSLSETSLRSQVIGSQHRNSNGTRRKFVLNDEESVAEPDDESRASVTMDGDEHQVHPPLPRNWLESVAKALLSGVGGPAPVTPDTASTRTTKTASTRKSSALSDKSNPGERGRPLTRGSRPPLLCVQVQDVKARTSEGQVACTRVMCRSTPTSRTSSRARNSGHDDPTNVIANGKKGAGDKSGNRRRGKDRDNDVVPSLARTKAENDDWMAPRQRYSGGWGMQGSAQAYPDGEWSNDSDGDADDDEDEEGELGLDRLLVPARRQHSIQSLRKHLQRTSSRMLNTHASHPRSPRSGRASPFRGPPPGRDWGDASWGTSRGREWLTSQGEEDEEGYSHAFSSARSSTKWRRALPGLAQWTTSS